MIKFNNSRKVYLYSSKVDMRMGIRKIQLLVASNFKQEDILESVFVFCSCRQSILKIYYEDEYGCWLLQDVIKEGKFKWPQLIEENTRISKQQLDGILKGLEVIESTKKNGDNGTDYF